MDTSAFILHCHVVLCMWLCTNVSNYLVSLSNILQCSKLTSNLSVLKHVFVHQLLLLLAHLSCVSSWLPLSHFWGRESMLSTFFNVQSFAPKPNTLWTMVTHYGPWYPRSGLTAFCVDRLSIMYITCMRTFQACIRVGDACLTVGGYYVCRMYLLNP